jgi:hypothetical protein
MKRIVLAFFAAFLCTYLALGVAHAQEDAAPFAGKCFGDGTSTCLVPELSFNVGTVALTGPNAGKFSAGAVPVGAGYALLFGFDQWWASGPSAHVIVDLSQAQANFVQLSLMATVFRYVHAGVVWSMLGSERTWYAAAGLTLPIDLVTTAVADKRAKAVRAYRATRVVPAGGGE